MNLRRDQLPRELTDATNWVGWKREVRNDRETKVLYNLRSGRHGRSNVPEDWVSFADAEHLATDDYEGLGFVFSHALGIVGGDLDDCLDESDNMKPWAIDIMRGFQNTYAEISPSGKGIKFFCRGVLPGSGLKVYVNAKGEPVKEGDPDADGAVELYDRGRYFTVTGRAIGPLELTGCQQQIEALYSRLRGRRRDAEPSPATLADSGEAVTSGGRHAYLLAIAGKWRNGGMDAEAMLLGLRHLNRTKCQPPKDEYELKGIVDWLLSKPPKYTLTPKDFELSRQALSPESRQAINGGQIPEPLKDEADEPTRATSQPDGDALQRVEEMLLSIIESADANRIYDDEFVEVIARAGSIKQHEAKRRLKAVFKGAFAIAEWEARIIAVQREQEQSFSAYIKNPDGSLIPNVANAITMMRVLPLRYNSFTCRAFLTAKSPWGSIGDWTDNDDVRCAEWCQHQSLNINKNTAADATNAIALSRPHHHPVVEYLQSLQWDGEPRIDTWLIQYLGVTDTRYVRNVGAKWMIQAVARVMQPGCQADYTLVLEGGQGLRKSTALRVLCADDFFTDDLIGIGSKDSAMQLQGKWIVEVAELDAFRRADMTTIKAWLVRRTDHFRPPYGRRAADFPRQNVFAASTNTEDWLNDDSGGRRFWPVMVGDKINVQGLAAVRDQLWAEAMFRYSEGELPYFSDEVEKLAASEQGERQDRDIWTDQVEQWIKAPTSRKSDFGTAAVVLRSTPGKIYVPEVLAHCIGMPEKDSHNGHAKRVTGILRLAGYKKHRDSVAGDDGKRSGFWEK